MNNYYLYFHINPLLNKVFYVGIGKTYNKNGNPKRPYSKLNRNKFWYNVVNKYGYIVDIIETDLSLKMAKNREKFYIKWFGRRDLKCGYLVNISDGGDGNFNPSAETRQKIADAQRKRKGYKMSSEAIENMIKSRLGSKRSEESKQKMSEIRKGIKFTDKHKENLSKAKKGKPGNNKNINVSIDTKNKIRETLSGISEEIRKLIEYDIFIENMSIKNISIKYELLKNQIYNIKYYKLKQLKKDKIL